MQSMVLKYPPYNKFDKFTDLTADRFEVLFDLLSELGLPFKIANIAGNRHFLVGFGSNPAADNGKNKAKIVMTAHYDRVPCSPGANDNGAAVFILLETAMKLAQIKNSSWMIIFTDKEELQNGENIKEQGAYSLALGLREAGLKYADFFNFDACGRGDTLIISTTCDYLLKKEEGVRSASTKKQLQKLRSTALDAANKTQGGHYLLMPTPFSDDLGFLRAGIAAQTITVLPYKEAAAFAVQSRGNPLYIDALINREQQKTQTGILTPQTWLDLNGTGDSTGKLNPEHFYAMIKFILCLITGYPQ